jgi:hypothetical protein
MDIARLKSLIAHENGDKVLQEFFRENLGGDASKYFQEKMGDAEKKIHELENLVEAVAKTDPVRVEKEKEWQEKEVGYKEEILKLEKMNSQLMESNEGDLIGSLEKKNQEITDLKNKIEYFNKVKFYMDELKIGPGRIAKGNRKFREIMGGFRSSKYKENLKFGFD